MVFVVAVVGATLPEVAAAIERLAPCSLPHAHQPDLQPTGWLGERCCAYHDAASATLWLGVAAAAAPAGGDVPAWSREQVRAHEAEAARALLAAFLTSHAVLWLGQARGPVLLPRATELMQRLRLAQQLKGALLPALPALLGLGPGEAGAATPGLCIPQLLVLAQDPHGAQAAGNEAGGGEAAAAAERQLRLLLKRCRVLLPEDNPRALCTLPAAAPLVLHLPERLGAGGSQEQLVADALAELAPPTPGQQPQQQQERQPARSSPAAVVAAALEAQRAAVAPAAPGVQSWRGALQAVADALGAAALKAAGAAAEAAAEAAVPSEVAAAVSWQEACGDSVHQFSLASCKRAAAVAAEAYRRNTPPLLPAAGHGVAAQAALRLYRSLARGPAAEAGAAALRQQLDDHWRSGHQQCEAVSFLGNPCCLPAHDPQQQAHTSSKDTARPVLLLATGSGAQQRRIPEPFTVAELQQAAAAVASEAASAAGRAQFFVRQLTAAGAGSSALAGAAAAAAGQAAAAPAGAEVAEAEEEEAAAVRHRLSGDGHSSDEEAGGAAEGAAEPGAQAAAAAARAAAGWPAAGCWLELHVLGPRAMWKSPALAAALLMDGQPGWLRSGGCMIATLPMLVAVPGKVGQAAAQASAAQQAGEPQEEFPSLAEVKQQEEQRRRRGTPVKKQAARAKSEDAAAEGQAAAEPQHPRLLTWPGWQPDAAAGPGAPQAAARPQAPGGRGRGRGPQQRGAQQRRQAGAAAAAAGGAAGAEQFTLLLGVEYESLAGQRLLLTPALLAAAQQSSLDVVSVRQQAPAAAARPGHKTAAAAAAAAQVPAAPGSAAFLLQQDLPLWLQMPGEQLAQLGGSKRRSAPGGAASSAGDRPAPVWLQLRRVLVGTPDVAVPLEAAPQLLLEVPRDMLAPAGAPQQPSSSAGGDTVQLQYSLAAPVRVPPGSFCALALPWLLTAPMAGGARGSGSGTVPAALIRQSGPLRAVLAGGTVLRPAAQQGA